MAAAALLPCLTWLLHLRFLRASVASASVSQARTDRPSQPAYRLFIPPEEQGKKKPLTNNTHNYHIAGVHSTHTSYLISASEVIPI